MRTVEKHGGLDAYLLQARNAELAVEARELKREIAAAKLAQIAVALIIIFKTQRQMRAGSSMSRNILGLKYWRANSGIFQRPIQLVISRAVYRG